MTEGFRRSTDGMKFPWKFKFYFICIFPFTGMYTTHTHTISFPSAVLFVVFIGEIHAAISELQSVVAIVIIKCKYADL